MGWAPRLGDGKRSSGLGFLSCSKAILLVCLDIRKAFLKWKAFLTNPKTGRLLPVTGAMGCAFPAYAGDLQLGAGSFCLQACSGAVRLFHLLASNRGMRPTQQAVMIAEGAVLPASLLLCLGGGRVL